METKGGPGSAMIGLTQQKAPSAEEEATVTIVTTARSMMMQLLRESVPIARIAERLGVSRQTIFNWKKRAKIESRRIQRCWQFTGGIWP
ncbi:MAG: helix-turn-helix domain-containing protein [Acidobacteria bacterium]|nr:helix-turn-helix domain-containing protein [Acidobacteriota bacterium]